MNRIPEVEFASQLPLALQGTVSGGGGQTQYVLADQAGFKTASFDGGHLIAYPQSGGGLGQEVEMVQYVDNTGQELSQEDVQYYALDGQEYSVIQANEEIVVSTEPRLQHEEHHLRPVVLETVSPPKARGQRAAAKRKTAATADTAKTYARGRGGGTVSATVVNSAQGSQGAHGRAATHGKKLVIVDEDHQHYGANKVQSLHLSNGAQLSQGAVSTLSFVTQGGQAHHV